jgi:hypothetical protein
MVQGKLKFMTLVLSSPKAFSAGAPPHLQTHVYQVATGARALLVQHVTYREVDGASIRRRVSSAFPAPRAEQPTMEKEGVTVPPSPLQAAPRHAVCAYALCGVVHVDRTGERTRRNMQFFA